MTRARGCFKGASLEATRRPELRAIYDRAGTTFADAAHALLAAWGSADPERHAQELIAWTDGMMFLHAAGRVTGSRTPTRGAAARRVRGPAARHARRLTTGRSGNSAAPASPLRGVPVRRRAQQCGRVHPTHAAGALLTGLTTLAAVAGCVTVSPVPATGSGTGARHGPGAGSPATAAPAPAASPLPGRDELATIGPVPRPRRTSAAPAPAPSAGAARPDVSAPGDGLPPAPETPAPRTGQGRPARTAQPAPPPRTPAASGGAVDLCGLAGDYGRWAPGSREDAACAEYLER
ncbi:MULTISPECIES: hypothetical protein [unclassified Streptomyces]|uniref:hypothetical protein n=1 Tax=unclassified Streptomyces TaxID=2593676 RepID=UPI000A4DED20|nr:hypothetical protein [Streptomyces sp. CNQ-509]